MSPLFSIPNLSLSVIGAVLCASCLSSPATGAENAGFPPHTFTLPDGYTLELAVPPTLVPRPIHMAFDDEGALYATDSSGNTDKAPVQLKNPEHRVLRVVDTDGDGIFDESTVFADQLPFPEGLLVHEGAVYVGAPPHIWKLRDTDGDHVADERTVWFDGGSIEGCGNDMHGPYLGSDGFFYWCKGAFAPQSHELANGKTLRSSAAHIYRARPDGSQLEVVITGGMNNPVGLAFSESGERFLSGTFFDLSAPGKRDGILHAVYGGVYGRENKRVLAPHPRTGDLLPVMTHMGPAAPSGIVMARSDALGLEGDLLCADFNLRRLSRHRLRSDGSSYLAETSSFLESDQSDFHPTDVIEDADGSLLVADTGSWYMICCPTSKVAKPHVLGGIYRIRREGSPQVDDPRGLELNWEKPEVNWLSDERPAVVRRAIAALATETRIEALRSAEGRPPALWSLHRIPGESARQAVRESLDDENADVRAAAMHSVGLWRDPKSVDRLIELLGCEDPREERLAAMALGRIGDHRAVKPLLAAASKKGSDAFLTHAITHALYEMGDAIDLPADHPVSAVVNAMHEVEKEGVPVHDLPEIALAKAPEPAPEVLARKEARLKELSALLPGGDPERGKKIFTNAAKSLCLTCHVMGEQGVEFGPDLTGIGSIRSEQDLLEAIVFPSATIARYYEMVVVKRKKGETVGLIRRDTTDHLVLAAAPGVEQRVPIREIKAARYSHVSLMPEVFDALLQPREIADLVTYLKTETLPGSSGPADGQAGAGETEIPPHRPVALPGLHAYAQKSIAAGEEIEFRVSSSVPYKFSLVRLGSDPENRENDPVLETATVESPQSQPVHPGSYVQVAKGLPAERRLAGLTLEGWVRPFRLQGWQGLITQHGYPDRCGVGLFLNGGRIAFMTGAGEKHDPATLHQTQPGLIREQNWHHVAATWDGKNKRIYVDGTLVGEFPFAGAVRPGRTALRLGAYGSEGVAANFYDGDLAMCAIHDRALDGDQIRQRVADRGLRTPGEASVLACWPFAEERGTRVADAGPDGRHGQIVNRGTWMIGGPGFDASAIDRHDTEYDPTRDPKRGHGLRLASDELYNARWEVSHRCRVPADAGSGAYAGRFDFEIDGKPMRYFTSFIVKRPESRPKAPLLVLVSSNTWLAYNSAPFPVNHGPDMTKMGTGGLASSHPDAATYSFYRDHRHGQPTYKVGLKLPWPAAGPNKTYINQSYSHLLRGERFLHLWLDRHGYEYDVITDRDLDRNPEILEGYEAVILNGHSEYWSVPAYEGLDRYLKAGGATLVMSGNTMFWRVSFDDTGEVMECRKYGKGIGGRANAQVGELYHSHDFRRGSLMRFCGYPAWKMVGLTCIGWGGAFQPYRVEKSDHFLFQRPHRIALKDGETFGYIDEKTGAVGHEFDVRLSTLQRATADPVIKGLVEPEGIVTIASAQASRNILDFNAEGHKPRVGGEETIAEIIYWERPEGGRVFHTGAIATAWGLYHDENLSKLVRNALHHFGVKGKDK
ncbi:MAG: HEAT repeat domain-containing protein [Verrucomicrobiales bacterium]|nr:HEAT repeat domain-containing protein [Verrucomicrobiales bacterium]